MPPPLEFESDDVIYCFPVKYPKFFARAQALPLILSKTSKNRDSLIFAVGARKLDDFFYLIVLNAPNFVLKIHKFAKNCRF